MTHPPSFARRTIALHPNNADAARPENPNGGMTRRGALQVMAASLALASGACTREPVERIYPYVNMPEAGRGGLPTYYASAFVREGYASGVLVGTREGRPIKIEGNPSHPSSLGATDVFAQASILELWDPDRSQSVWQQLPTLGRNASAPALGSTSASNSSAGSSPITASTRPPGSAESTWETFDAAWRQQATLLEGRRGRGLAILTPHFTSASFGGQLTALLKRFPEARWHRHSALAPDASRAGARLAHGRELDWLYRFDRARFVLTLDADPFSDGPGRLRHAHDWAQQRAGTGPGEAGRAAAAPTSFAVETTPGLFGARADARIAMEPAAIEALVDALMARFDGMATASSAPPASLDAAHAAALATRLVDRLKDAGGASLVIAGRQLSARAHAQVAALNQRLGAIGRTLDAIAPLDAVVGIAPQDLTSLVDAMNGGGVDTLLIAGCNPVYDAPGFAEAMRGVGFSAHLGLHRDETGHLTTWHLPASHDYESWGDACGHDGTQTLIQPAILPLYDTRSPLEWLAGLNGSMTREGHALVRATWQQRMTATPALVDAAGFDTWWRATLRAGVLDGSAAAPVSLTPARTIAPPAAAGSSQADDSLVAVFVADASVDSGRFANNGWLQELPRPFTALTWDNAIHLGPKTASRHGVVTGDVVRLDAVSDAAPAAGSRVGAHLEGPVWVVAEHAEGVATLPLGYGRSAAGGVGDGVGFDANVLRKAAGGPVAITLLRTGRTHRFAVTQHRIDQMGRDLARSVLASAPMPADPPNPSLYAPMASPEHAWAMTIDLDACIGCNACTIACQAENNIPVVGAEEVARGREMHWIRVDRYGSDSAEAGSIFQPVPCMHCENAPCEVVCPVGATVHDSEGLNVQVYNRCVGTRFCSNNCPYKVRRFNFLKYEDDTTESFKAMRNPDVTVRQRGVMEKCTYCVQRLSRARLGAEKAGTGIADGDVLTACQSACPTRAIHFGDLRDAGSDVVRAKASPRHYAMLGELNTKPRTTYLARVLQPHDTASPAGGRSAT